MTWGSASDIARIVAASHVLLLVGILAYRFRSLDRLYFVFIGLGGASALIFTILYRQEPPAFVLLPFAVLQSGASFWFWMFAVSQGRENFQPNWKHWLLLTGKIFLTITWGARYRTILLPIDPQQDFVWRALLPAVLTLGFVIAAVWASGSHMEDELVENRLSIRRITVFWGAGTIIAVMGLVLLFRGPFLSEIGDWITSLVAIAICVNIHIWLAKNSIPIVESTVRPYVDDPELKQIARKIQEFMIKDDYYCTEGLTISQLASNMQEKEYKIRRAINGILGYKNFNVFLNQYRIENARKCLIGEPDLPVIRLAMDLGYRSLAVFNKAFKETTGRTPTDFRRAEKSD
ncbi:MAG: AraC family transcriptional regulator [Leptospira sp.]|nr:AraC family transcriptional regulator [Leptospira sp.]NCS93139.1 AraC family transcriptional regulator [Leptospira sp.]